jgi:hypothetical protein
MSRIALLVAFVAALVQPAVAQTDDRVLNDMLVVLAADAMITDMGESCAAASGNNPTIAAAFAEFAERSIAWQIVAVGLIGSRGGLRSGVLEAARAEAIAKGRADFAADPNPVRSCESFAEMVAGQQLDLADMYPAETKRMSEARGRMWPVVDVDAEPEVADALAVKQLFAMREAMLERCGVLLGNERLYRDAHAYWRSQNIAAYRLAHEVQVAWGAMAPERLERVIAAGEAEAEAVFEAPGGGEERCRQFVSGLEAGEEDVAQQMPEVMARLEAARR